jgi:hypothetical protein
MAEQGCPGWRRPSTFAARSAAWAQQDQETRRQIAPGAFDAANNAADQFARSANWPSAELGSRSDQSVGETDKPVAEQSHDGRDVEISRLAALPLLQYFGERETACESLGLKKAQLDECVKAARKAQKQRDAAQRNKDPGIARADRRELDIGSDEEIANRVISDMLAKHSAHAQQGASVLVDGALCTHSEGAFFAYTGRVWEFLTDAEFQREFVSPYDGARYGSEGIVKLNKSKVESISWLTARNMEVCDFFAVAEPGVNCESGFVKFHPDGRTELVPHDPSHRSRHILYGHYNPGETFILPNDSLLSRFLNGLFRDDEDAAEKQALLQEVAGAAVAGLGTRLRQPKAIVLYGRSANNGKSTVLDLLEGLLGTAACSHVSPHRFDQPNAAVAMRGKLGTPPIASKARVCAPIQSASAWVQLASA